MQESNENTHAAPKLVNRPSPHTLPRPCDLGHGHGKTSQSGPSTRHNCPEPRNHESAPENVIATQTRVLSRMSINTSTLQRTWHDGRYLLFSSVATHTDKDHQRQHVMGTAQDADKKTYVCGRNELRQNTRRTDASEHQLSASSPRTTQKVSPSNGVRTQNKTHMAHDTATNKPTLPRLTVCHVAVLYGTLHTDLVCPMMMFPNDMTNHYSTHKS